MSGQRAQPELPAGKRKMSVLRRMMRVSNRSLLAFIFFFSLSSSCLYFIYVAPGIGKHRDTPSLPMVTLEETQDVT